MKQELNCPPNDQFTRLTQWVKEVFETGRKQGHDDAQIMKWVKTYTKHGNYSNEQTSLALVSNDIWPERRKLDPTMIICPRCHESGRVNKFHRPTDSREHVSYVVVHEPVKGTWGETRLQKRRRCYMVKPAHRREALKQIERYNELKEVDTK
jgi:hypothetical protein